MSNSLKSYELKTEALASETDRVEIFSDAVFAIAITILVLDIKMPTEFHDFYSAALTPTILSLLPTILSYILSFLLIGTNWIIHHHIFNYIKKVNSTMMRLNLAFLMTVAFIPFPTSVLASYPHNTFSYVFYGLNLSLESFVLYLLWKYATDNRRLVSENLPEQVVSSIKTEIFLSTAFYLVGAFISIFSNGAGLAFYILALVYFCLPKPFEKMLYFYRKYASVKKD